MARIPEQLATRLAPDSLELNCSVQRISDGGVVLGDGEERQAKALVVATGGPEAARLLGREPTKTRGTTCFYFSAPLPPIKGPYLVLDGNGGGPINSLLCPSNLSRAYAPAGRTLVTVNCFGDHRDPDALEPQVLRQLRDWFGDAVDAWQRLAVYLISHALPVQAPPVSAPSAAWSGQNQRLSEQVWSCGEFSAPPSIHWALASGRLAGEAVARSLHGVSE
jgi:hypothetical protein